MQPWKTLSSETLIENSWLKLESRSVQIPDGRVIDGWLWVIVPDYVNVVAVNSAGKFLVFRQQKYAARGLTLALIGGMIDAGEAPLEAAKRELLEETGYVSKRWISLGEYATDANRGVGRGHLYLALDASLAGKIASDDLEDQEFLALSESEIRAAMLSGDFQVMSWVAAIGLAFAHLNKN